MVRRLVRKLRSPALHPALRRTVGKIIRARLDCYDELRGLFERKTGLELGGPSPMFRRRKLFPIYPLAARIDNCNFSHETVWQGQIAAGRSFRFDKRREPGSQFFAEATDLRFAASATYDFVLSSHVLEHTANPLKALVEAKRVLKLNGALFLVVPHKDGTFDHRRPVTPLQHIVKDFELVTGEDDLTHLPEILALHDLSLDPGQGSAEEFRRRSENNFENRCLHHHVFDTRLVVALVDTLRLQVRAVEAVHPHHIVVVATKPADETTVDNQRFLGRDAAYRRSSPFPSDHSAP